MRITVISCWEHGDVVCFICGLLVSGILSLHTHFGQELCTWSLFVVESFSVICLILVTCHKFIYLIYLWEHKFSEVCKHAYVI